VSVDSVPTGATRRRSGVDIAIEIGWTPAQELHVLADELYDELLDAGYSFDNPETYDKAMEWAMRVDRTMSRR
jgi:hypothetical protein